MYCCTGFLNVLLCCTGFINVLLCCTGFINVPVRRCSVDSSPWLAHGSNLKISKKIN